MKKLKKNFVLFVSFAVELVLARKLNIFC